MTDERKGYCGGDREKCTTCMKIVPYTDKHEYPFGTLGRPGRDGKRRVKGCNDKVAMGKRNRTKGLAKQRVARKKLGLASTGFSNSSNEEDWTGVFRVECKAGAQVGPIATRFNQARLQSLAAKSLGDLRPFCMLAMPDGSRDGIVLMSLSEFAELVSVLTSVQQT